MKKSIKFQLLLLFSIVIFVVIILNIVFNIMFLKNYYIAQNEKIIREVAIEVGELLEDAGINKIFNTFESQRDNFDIRVHEELLHFDRIKNLSILIVDKSLVPITASYRLDNIRTVPIDKNLTTLIKSNKELLEHSYLYTSTYQNDTNRNITYVEKLSNDGYMIFTRPIAIMEDNISISNNFNIIIGIIALIIGNLLTISFSKTFTNPIIEMSKITEDMSNLKFNNKIKYEYKNELGTLANSINILSMELEKNIKKLHAEIEFQKLLSRNMSHELKTPIAVIKGYTEGLLYGVADSEELQSEYFNTIIEECDRMDKLVKDMLELSRLNSENYSLQDVDEFFSKNIEQKIVKLFTPAFKNTDLNFECVVDEFSFKGNFSLILQAVSNLISNALKYGDSKYISLKIYEKEKFNIIEVFNSGSEIPQDELDNIFKVFYRLDKARSRSLNAHGLGLSIVEMISKLHNGDINIENKDGGVLFILKFSKFI